MFIDNKYSIFQVCVKCPESLKLQVGGRLENIRGASRGGRGGVLWRFLSYSWRQTSNILSATPLKSSVPHLILKFPSLTWITVNTCSQSPYLLGATPKLKTAPHIFWKAAHAPGIYDPLCQFWGPNQLYSRGIYGQSFLNNNDRYISIVIHGKSTYNPEKSLHYLRQLFNNDLGQLFNNDL